MITDFPFRVIPRTVDTKILKIKDGESNTKNAGSTPISNHRNRSKNETRSSQQQQPNIDVIMKHAAKGFVDDQTQVTSTYRTKLAAFGVPLQIEIATLHNKYDIFEVAVSDEDIRNIDVTPISVRVRNKTTCLEYTARMQGRMKSVANAKILDLDGERKFLASISTSQSKKENSLISRLLDSGFDSDFRYIIVEDAGRDLKTLLDHYKYFEPPTVFLITYYSFQAIKELHSYGYYHMDLRLSSFSISPTFNLKIVEFFRVTSSKSTCKVSHKFRLDRFVSRKYHKQGAIFDPFDDYENWLFVIMFISCESKLPWKHNGKNGFLESKEAFFKRRDDYNWCGSTDSLILIPYLMEKKKNISEFIEAVDKLFSIDVMGFKETTLPDWGTSMNEVSRKLKKTRKAAVWYELFFFYSTQDFEDQIVRIAQRKNNHVTRVVLIAARKALKRNPAECLSIFTQMAGKMKHRRGNNREIEDEICSEYKELFNKIEMHPTIKLLKSLHVTEKVYTKFGMEYSLNISSQKKDTLKRLSNIKETSRNSTPKS